jgi:hypothetical protein
MGSTAPEQDEAPQPIRVQNLYDASEVKRVLDEFASQARSGVLLGVSSHRQLSRDSRCTWSDDC